MPNTLRGLGMADVQANKEGTPPKKEEGSEAKVEQSPDSESKVENLWSIYDVTSRGATKSLHDAAERGKVKDVIMFLSKMKRAAEVRERTRTTSQCEVRKQRKNALTN